MESISNYINGPLREYIQKKSNLKLDSILISYDPHNKKLIFGNGEYAEVLKKDYLNIINDIINKTNNKAKTIVIESNNLSSPIIESKPKRKYKSKKEEKVIVPLSAELYFDIIPEEILIEILKYTLGYDYFDKYIKLSEIDLENYLKI